MVVYDQNFNFIWQFQVFSFFVAGNYLSIQRSGQSKAYIKTIKIQKLKFYFFVLNNSKIEKQKMCYSETILVRIN